MQSHRLTKIVVSSGVGKLRSNVKFDESILPKIVADFSTIVGQKPAPRGAKKSIATFKTRTGDVVGLVATLRGKRMNDFLSRLVNVALPRVRDFRGIDPKNFDSRGNLSIGIKEHTIFPEINPEKTPTTFGLQVTFTTDTKTKEEGIALCRKLGIPLKKA
ncbi:MAG: 50S ribosomal protein L5 [Candidatus Colwellbacteria bacterium RIFCSPLOWO2_01_FULL_48_10]|uniref:Large ribosomal subunit protein uL5 n=1 Tax=Candidatus Colwellbacteria bacterium RIFCSPLOWO2_01_FULL_48_10 TaxID=1797690 RepID=A0A1G1Z6B8_9BACT|nr:MAG: 50S ribosomal protein L5 [Candidatus Colwellbacteria bacterium RIFCSPLOWO2_01_FULL_48_10]